MYDIDLETRYRRLSQEYRGACDLVNTCGYGIGGAHLSRAAIDLWEAAAALYAERTA